MRVVDTNVLVSLLLAGAHTESALALHAKDGDWRSEAFVLTELANVLATQVRSRAMPLADALGELARGAAVMRDGLIEVGHSTALSLAAQFEVSAYDARYLAVAQALRTRLVTEDVKLRKKVPELTCSILEAVSG